jgi:predicted dehydrogenase
MTGVHFEVHALGRSAVIPKQRRGVRVAVSGVRVAVIGCGYWGSKHVRVLSGLPDVRQVAIVDADPRIRAAILSAFPAARAFSDLKSALPHVDAVVIATPPQTHGELALMALQHGKHVLVEKPLTRSLAEARLLVGEARRCKSVLMTGHTFLFNPAVKELRRRVAKGELGEVCYVHSARLNLGFYRRYDGNVIWDLAPHDITIMNYLLQSVPTTVSAWGASLGHEGVQDVAYIRLDYQQLGISGYSHVSWIDPRKARTVTVVGEEKMAIYDDLADERLRIFDHGVKGLNGGAPPAYERPMSYWRYGDMRTRADEPLALEDQHFVDCIRDRAIPETDGLNGMVVIAILESIDRSLREGMPINVDYPFDLNGLDYEGKTC